MSAVIRITASVYPLCIMYIHVWVIECSSLSTIFLFDFGTVPEVPYFWFFILYLICHLILVCLHAHVFINALKVNMTVFSHFRDRPVPIFSDVGVFLSCSSARQKNQMRFTDKYMLYSLCQLPPPPPSSNYPSFSFLK